MKKFRCRQCGSWMELIPFGEPVYEEKDGEIVSPLKDDTLIDRLAYKMMNNRLDSMEVKVEELPKLFKKMVNEVYEQGYKAGKKNKLATGTKRDKSSKTMRTNARKKDIQRK